MDLLRAGVQAGAMTNPYLAAFSLVNSMAQPQQQEGPEMGFGGGLESILQKALSGLGGGAPQQTVENNSFQAPTPNPMINTTFQYAPPSPLNPLPPLFGKPERGLYGPY